MRSKKKIQIEPKDIKYNVYNTKLPVTITHDNKVYFDVDPKDQDAVMANDTAKINEYKEKVKQTMEYLFLEGFLTDSEDIEE